MCKKKFVRGVQQGVTYLSRALELLHEGQTDSRVLFHGDSSEFSMQQQLMMISFISSQRMAKHQNLTQAHWLSSFWFTEWVFFVAVLAVILLSMLLNDQRSQKVWHQMTLSCFLLTLTRLAVFLNVAVAVPIHSYALEVIQYFTTQTP